MNGIIPFFSQVFPDLAEPKAVLHQLSDLFRERKLKKGSYFLEKNQPIDRIVFVTAGVLRIFTTDDQGNETNIVFVTEGGFTSGSFAPQDRSDVSIQCLTDVTLQVALYHPFFDVLEENRLLKKFLLEYLVHAHRHIQLILTQNAKLDAKERYHVFLDEYPGLLNRIPHYHVANYLGITTTQLSRIRRDISKSLK